MATNREDWKSYSVTWGRLSVFFVTRKRSFACICGFSKRICKLAGPKEIFTVLIIQNIYVNEKEQQCEEESRCLDFSCPFNKTTRESFAVSMRIKPKSLPKDFGQQPIGFNLLPDGKLRDFSGWCKDHTALIYRGKGHAS